MNTRPSQAMANARVFRALSYGLVFLMMACTVLTIGVLIRHAAPDASAAVIAGILTFVLIDRLYTYRQFKSLSLFSSEWFLGVGAQWVLIVLVSRFLLSYARGLDSFREDLSHWARGSITDFITPELIFTLLLALLIWYGTGRFLALLDEIGLDQETALREESPPIQNEAVPAHQRLVGLIFNVGILVVVLAALTRINFEPILTNTQGLPKIQVSRFSGAEAGALLYFVFGLALLSLSRLMALQTRWNRLRIPISSANLARQWGVYSLVFLFLLALVVSLLPAGDSLGLFAVMGMLLGFILQVLTFLALVLFGLIWLLFSIPFLLLGKAPPEALLPPPTSLHNLPSPPPSQVMDNALFELIRSVLLWGGLAVIVIFALRQFVLQHGGLAAALRKSRLANWLTLAWQWLYRNAGRTGESLARAISEGWQSILSRLEGKGILAPAAWINFRALDPRRRIFFFYLAMVRRGQEQGIRRKASHTPAEYARQLDRALPSASEDIDSITEAFIEARYSRQEVDSDKANQVKAIWGRIRRALQEKAKGD